jgi:hypothetical protein
MGFLSKIWKGIKKVTKKIFKPIKKIFKSVGKFMNKIGIVGQIAMSFLLPGIGTALSGMFSGMVSSLAGGALGTIGKAAGWVLGKAGQFAKTISTGFKTVTSAVTDFIGAAGKYVGGRLGEIGIGGMERITLKQAFGAEGWAGKLVKNFTKFTDAGKGLFTDGLSDFAERGIMTPAEIAAQETIPVEDLSMTTDEIDGIDGRAAPPEVINTVDTLDPNKNYRISSIDGAPYEVAPDTTRSMLADPAAVPTGKVENFYGGELGDSYFTETSTAAAPASATSNRLLDSVKQGERIRAATPASTLPIPQASSSANMGLFEKVTGKKDMSTLFKDAPGDLLDYGVDTVKGIPGRAVDNQIMALIQGRPEAYEEGYLWDGNTYAYQSQDYSRITGGAASDDYFASFINFNDSNGMYNNLPQGQYGGIDAFNTFYQRGTA